jgi:putative ABC transport system permease protein
MPYGDTTRQVVGDVARVTAVETVERQVAASLAVPRFRVLLGSLFAAAAAMLLAVVGLLGVISHTVSRRTHELGVRRALGATGMEIVGLVVRHGMTLAALGIALGVFLAWGLTRLLASLLYEVEPTDPVTFAAVTLLLALVAAVAAYLPARRAMRIDPLEALQAD